MTTYFNSLLHKFDASDISKYQICKDVTDGGNFVPSSLIPESAHAERLNLIEYDELLKSYDGGELKNIRLIYQELHGGIGTGVQRQVYMRHRKLGTVSAKGIDLVYEVPGVQGNHRLSILEIRLLRLLKLADKFKKISLQYFVNTESQQALSWLLDKPCYDSILYGPSPETYREHVLRRKPNIEFQAPLVQALNPTVTAIDGRLSQNHLAPGGHGELATVILDKLASSQDGNDEKTIRAVYKGNSFNEFPNEAVIEWMAREDIPIAMIVRPRTPTDASGGVFGIERLADGTEVLQLCERYQAEQSDQTEEFLNIGVNAPYRQYYNTNTVLINDTVLSPFLVGLKALIGSETYEKLILPDLCLNKKEINGITYIQLEGILGTPFLNLNRFLQASTDRRIRQLVQRHDMERLIYLVNAGTQNVAASTSVKTSLNFWLFAHTDHFWLDTKSWMLVNRRPGHVIAFGPDIKKNPYYRDLHQLIDALEGLSVIGLDYLNIKGRVKLAHAKLKGRIEIVSECSDMVDLNSPATKELLPLDEAGNICLENVSVTINEHGLLHIQEEPVLLAI